MVHFEADIIEHINDLLVILLSLCLFGCQSHSQLVELLSEVRYLAHCFQLIQSEHDLCLHLVPLCLVIEKKHLYLSD